MTKLEERETPKWIYSLHLSVHRSNKILYKALGMTDKQWEDREKALLKKISEAPDYGDEPYGA
jgi:hypothetical protein